jgi:hypothetical protein
MGEVEAYGVEGTGSYGKALTRFLRAHGEVVIEVTGRTHPHVGLRASRIPSMPEPPPGLCSPVRPQGGRRRGRDDPGAASCALQLVKARTQAVNALKDLVVTAPDDLRERLRGLPRDELVATASESPGKRCQSGKLPNRNEW